MYFIERDFFVRLFRLGVFFGVWFGGRLSGEGGEQSAAAFAETFNHIFRRFTGEREVVAQAVDAHIFDRRTADELFVKPYFIVREPSAAARAV